MKTTASKENATPSQSSQPFFNKKGEGSFLSSTNEQEQPFFSPNPVFQKSSANSSFSVGNNAPRTPFSSPRLIQPKLTINEPGDQYEQEADAMADRVMRMSETPVGETVQTSPSPISPVQRKCAECEEEKNVQRQEMEEEEPLQTKPLMRKAAGGGYTASPQLTSQLSSSKGGGDPLPGKTLGFMNQAFGLDFSKVRIHTGTQAAEMSQGIQAKAFTHGSDVYFNRGQYNPNSSDGKYLLAHELTHTIQQGNGVYPQIQRLGPPFGPAASGPSNWATQVSAATNSTQKTALIQTAAGSGVTVNDATTASATDATPEPAHLRPFSIATPVINFDQNLASKNARVGGRRLNINAGYTFQNGTTNYVVIGDLALDGTNYGQTVQTINHEFDHINQYLRSSPLRGNESELDAWISTFIREFHHSYSFRPTTSGTTCYVELAASFAPLLMYYQLVTNATQRTSAVSRISAYYTATISSHAANRHAFHFWVFRSMGSASNPDLGTDVNTALSLGISASGSATTYRAIPCSSVPSASLPGSSVLVMPTAPATTGTTSTPSRP